MFVPLANLTFIQNLIRLELISKYDYKQPRVKNFTLE